MIRTIIKSPSKHKPKSATSIQLLKMIKEKDLPGKLLSTKYFPHFVKGNLKANSNFKPKSIKSLQGLNHQMRLNGGHHSKQVKSQVINQISDLDLDYLTRIHRREMHKSETIVIDTKGNNNLNLAPNYISNVNIHEFKWLISKPMKEISRNDNKLVLYSNTIFTKKDKEEIDNVKPLTHDQDSFDNKLIKSSFISHCNEDNNDSFSLESFEEIDLKDTTP